MAFNGARLPIVRRKPALFWLHGVNKMFCAACVCIVLRRSLLLKPLSDSLLPPQQMHTIKHCNDLFSPRSTASLWMKFTKKCGGQRIWQDGGHYESEWKEKPAGERAWAQKDRGGPTFLTCASLIFSKATRILSAFNLAACSSWMDTHGEV